MFYMRLLQEAINLTTVTRGVLGERNQSSLPHQFPPTKLFDYNDLVFV